jgi:hypothetical protein
MSSRFTRGSLVIAIKFLIVDLFFYKLVKLVIQASKVRVFSSFQDVFAKSFYPGFT